MSTSTVMRYIAEKLWPWFKAYIWPLLREYAVELFTLCMAELKSQLEQWITSRSELRANHAKKRAKHAEIHSEYAENESDRVKYRAEAAVWREVAEQFRQDNDELKAKLVELTQGSEALFKNNMAECDPDIDTTKSTPALLISNRRLELPPPPSKDSE